MAETKGKSVIVNHAHKFLATDGRTWVTTDGGFLVAGRTAALKTARGLPAAARGRGVYLVTDYGYASEAWWAVAPTGDVVPLPAAPALELDASGIV